MFARSFHTPPSLDPLVAATVPTPPSLPQSPANAAVSPLQHVTAGSSTSPLLLAEGPPQLQTTTNVFHTAGGSTGNIHQAHQQQQHLNQSLTATASLPLSIGAVGYAGHQHQHQQQPLYHQQPQQYSTGTVQRTAEMVSRRKILSRSRDDLNLEQQYHQQQQQQDDEDDVWYQKDKLYKVSADVQLIVARGSCVRAWMRTHSSRFA